MGKCEVCKREMLKSKGCGASTVSINGKKYKRIKVSDTLDFIPEVQRCHDCNAVTGHYHHWGCDAERCPECRLQLLSCDCEDVTLVVETCSPKRKVALAYINPEGTEKEYDNCILSCQLYSQMKSIELNAETLSTFIDYKVSSNENQRPELQNMIEILAKNKVDYVIIPYLKMLSSEEDTQKKLVHKIEKLGATIITFKKSDMGKFKKLLDEAQSNVT